MKFSIRFKIGNRYGAGSMYTLRDFCIAIIDRYSLTENEVFSIVTLQVGDTFTNNDLLIKRLT